MLLCSFCSADAASRYLARSDSSVCAQMQAMSKLDDDAALTQLATAWVDLYLVRAVLHSFSLSSGTAA